MTNGRTASLWIFDGIPVHPLIVHAPVVLIPLSDAVIAVGTVLFVAELGDKTMLAIVTLATKEGPFGTWIGSTVGMGAADALTIVAGRQLGTRLHERTIRFGATGAFFAFAAVLLSQAI